jgi:hypothetical protein
MRQRLATLIWILALALGAAVSAPLSAADPADTARSVDLRDAAALAELQRTNPVHYATIRQILAELEQQPQRVEGDWLQTNFDARDIELSRLLFKTSNPPRQLLRFTLDDTRYTLHVTRSDLTARPEVLR